MPVTDAQFHHTTTDDEATGEGAWESLKEEALARAAAERNQLPRVDLGFAARSALGMSARFLAEKGGIVGRLSDEEAEKVGAAIDRIPRLAHGTFYVATRYNTATSDKTFAEIVGEASLLREVGLRWMDVVEATGAIPAGATANIRSGRGHADTAGDLQAIAAHLGPLWGSLEPLQALQPDASQRITRADIDRMAAVGTRLFALLELSDTTPWRRELIGVSALLAEAWELARGAARYHLNRSGRGDEAEAIPSFLALRRAPTPSGGAPKGGEAPAEEPAPPVVEDPVVS